MSKKPILFSTPMVQAILDQRKSTTRRVVKPQPKQDYPLGFLSSSTDSLQIGKYGWGSHEHGGIIDLAKPPYQIGGILWVQETWADTWTPDSNDLGVIYKADGKPAIFPYWGNANKSKDEVWKPSIYMPRKVARLFLKVTNVRVERLQAISTKDIRSEGLTSMAVHCLDYEIASQEWKLLWDGIYGDPKPVKENGVITHFESYPWVDIHETTKHKGLPWVISGNPWVWVIEFERVIDYETKS